jgi:RluA family pseudouridine synthase
MTAILKQREARLQEVTSPLPGSIAYNNVRPMNVPQRFDRQPLIEFLCGMHAKLDREFWLEECRAERVTYKDQPLNAETETRAGWRIHHHVPQTTEPDVSRDVGFLFEDSDLIAVDKPAPLPMHPCGRFNRNTLQHFLDIVYSGEQIRILHRLDAETKGVVLLARKKSAASFVQQQFKDCEIRKIYLARIIGHPSEDRFDCSAPISVSPVTGGVRQVESTGRAALTQFEVIQRYDDGTSLIKCFPKTGRTNQIRLHLHSLGTPIVGDKDYSIDGLGAPTKLSAMGLCLQAIELAFVHPTSKELTVIKSKAPCDFAGSV